MTRPGLLVALLLLGCKTVSTAPVAPVTVQRFEVSFDADGRGELELALEIHGGDGLVTQAQWQLMLDGRPVGSGVQLVAHRVQGGTSTLRLVAPLPLSHTNRDDGWRNVGLEVAGELTINGLLAERWPFAARRQALLRGAPRPEAR